MNVIKSGRTVMAAYVAGVLDSDGSISVSRLHPKRPKPTYRGYIQLTWVASDASKHAIEDIKAAFGGSYCFVLRRSGFNTRRPELIKYNLSGPSLTPFLHEIIPFLRLKRKQAENVLALNEVVASFRGQPCPDSATEALEKLYESNKQLNAGITTEAA